ncbi:MAG: malonyl-CoA decarboxylase [Alphaproteobacteria bacterium]|nr:malonyl-CoA decarboxylase [Alphaproteobacteria bacterium]
MSETTSAPAKPSRLLVRTLVNLRSAWRDMSASARGAFGAPLRPDLPPEDAERLRAQFRDCVEARGGEVSARARAAALGRTYLELSPAGRRRFLEILAVDFDTDKAEVDAAIAELNAAQDARARRAAERALRQVLLPPRRRLLTHFNALPQGVKFLVDLRAELMPMARGDSALEMLEEDLKGLLSAWFDVDFLELQRITWQSPAALLEKLMVYEAVHEIRDWNDLKNRLDSDRRLFGFFHPRMPQEPLIFVEVALVKGMSASVQELLDPQAPLTDPAAADTAIFYSISNAQKGLAGISFGNFLIKRVVDSLTAEFKGLKTFATLSPIPGFRAWLEKRVAAEGADLLLPAERRSLVALDGEDPALLLDAEGWVDERVIAAVKPPLMRLCAHYLLNERAAPRRALDPVAHFHLSNGARIERLNWQADLSPKGLRQSAGIMVNYLYRLDRIEGNHEAYTGEGSIAASSSLRTLAAG